MRLPAGASTLEPVLECLASQPGKYQLHAQGALRFRERLKAKCVPKCEGKGEETENCEPNGEDRSPSKSISEYGDCSREGKLADQVKTVVLSALKSANSEPAMDRRRRAESRPLGLEGREGSWPPEVAKRLESPEVVLAQCLQTGGVSSPSRPPKRPSRSGLRLVAGAFNIPHPEKSSSGGADSYFIAPGGAGVGVSDGVGEWEWRFKCNPRAFADDLMRGSCAVSEELAGDANLDARDVALRALKRGYQEARAIGSATALVAWLSHGKGLLGVANLGDSAMLHLRRQRVGRLLGQRLQGRTREQQHGFNCPYQLSCMPGKADFPRLIAEGKHALVRCIQKNPDAAQDTPEDSDGYVFPVQEGDLLVLGTDGVFDNLHDNEVCQLANHAISPFEADERFDAASGQLVPGPGAPSTSPARLAEALALAALARSKDLNAKTPFSAHAQKAGLYHIGGKMDDITCICAWIVRDDD